MSNNPRDEALASDSPAGTGPRSYAFALESLTFGRRLAQESLLHGIRSLETALAVASVAQPWHSSIREALRDCTLALEHSLDTLDAAGGMREHVTQSEPGLLPCIERLEGALSEALVEAWQAQECADQARARLERLLERLASALRTIAEQEFDLVHSSLIRPGGEG